MASWYNEINPMSIEIVKLSCQGFSDRQIGEKLGCSRQTIYRYRHGLNISSGRNHKVQTPKKSAKKPKFLPLDKLILDYPEPLTQRKESDLAI